MASLPPIVNAFAAATAVHTHLLAGPFHKSWAGEEVDREHAHFLPRLLAKACYCGEAQVVEALLEAGTDTSYTDLSGRTALHHAAAGGSAAAARVLLKRGGVLLDCDKCNDENSIPSRHSASIDVNQRDLRCWTPLLIAVCKEQIEVALLLLDAGARVDLMYPHNSSPCRESGTHSQVIHFSAIRGSVSFIEKFLDHHAIGAKNALTFSEGALMLRDAAGRLPLHYACARSRNAPTIVRLLVRRCPPSVHVADGQGRTPLHVAAMRGALECVKFLLLNGADPTKEDIWLMNAFHVAFSADHVECAAFIHAAIVKSRGGPSVDTGVFEGCTSYPASAVMDRLTATQRRFHVLLSSMADASEPEQQFLGRVIWELGLDKSMELMTEATALAKQAGDRHGNVQDPIYILRQLIRAEVKGRRIPTRSWSFIQAPEMERMRSMRARRRRGTTDLR